MVIFNWIFYSVDTQERVIVKVALQWDTVQSDVYQEYVYAKKKMAKSAILNGQLQVLQLELH